MPRKCVLAQRTLESFLKAPPAPSATPVTKRGLELSELALPTKRQTTETRGRPAGSTTYIVRCVPFSTWTRVQELLEMVNGDASTMERLWKEFNDFCGMNPMQRRDLQYFVFLIDILEQGDRKSTRLNSSHRT